jgi:D-3-phosphoglycerate dehydrogenase
LNKINRIFTSRNLNIAAQYLQTDPHIGYVIIDIEGIENSKEVLKELKEIPETIKARMII